MRILSDTAAQRAILCISKEKVWCQLSASIKYDVFQAVTEELANESLHAVFQQGEKCHTAANRIIPSLFRQLSAVIFLVPPIRIGRVTVKFESHAKGSY